MRMCNLARMLKPGNVPHTACKQLLCVSSTCRPIYAPKAATKPKRQKTQNIHAQTAELSQICQIQARPGSVRRRHCYSAYGSCSERARRLDRPQTQSCRCACGTGGMLAQTLRQRSCNRVNVIKLCFLCQCLFAAKLTDWHQQKRYLIAAPTSYRPSQHGHYMSSICQHRKRTTGAASLQGPHTARQ